MIASADSLFSWLMVELSDEREQIASNYKPFPSAPAESISVAECLPAEAIIEILVSFGSMLIG
jgi:hypothetical protein